MTPEVEGPDTVARAAETPDVEQPWAELGLKADEYARIRSHLGRRCLLYTSPSPRDHG